MTTINKILLILFVTVFIQNCSVKPRAVIGYYQSECVLYDRVPIVSLTLRSDKTFIYKMALLNETITGDWEARKDTLLLSSKYFTEDYIRGKVIVERSKIEASNDTAAIRFFTDKTIRSMLPIIKYTRNRDRDIFLIKGGKLIAIDSNVVRKHCPLYKIK